MPTPSENLANSLEALKALQERDVIAIRSGDISRTHRKRLISNGFLQEVMKGWYIPSRPDEIAGESTAWYASFWHFCAAYLQERFGTDWCLSPEQSLFLHVGNWTVPQQLLVRAPKGGNKVTQLPHNTSLLDLRAMMPDKKNIEEKEDLKLFSIPLALITCAPAFYTQHPIDVRAALSTIKDASDILAILLEGGHSIVAGRLAGAFRNLGREHIADEIIKTMQLAGYDVRENDPFEAKPTVTLSSREVSPYANRLRLMWGNMRAPIIKIFPPAPGLPSDANAYLKLAEEIYATDAYHSLSIEGYRVSPKLIEQVRSGKWNPDKNDDDHEHRSALAARGYWLAHNAVMKSLRSTLNRKNVGLVAKKDHSDWFREMFAPSVTAGLLQPADLAGYRNNLVYIRRSMHVPPNHEAVRDLMPTFFELLQNESEASVRVVLGHFIFVYIHPYMDGNGRIGRFLMNLMLAAGGYPWTVIPVEKRSEYMAALEDASVRQNIEPFAHFLADLVKSIDT